jgi:hypothetical protein
VSMKYFFAGLAEGYRNENKILVDEKEELI